MKYLAILIAGVVLGALFFGGVFSNDEQESHSTTNEEVGHVDEVWTCSMHPQIRQSEPGDCPICGMDLIKLHTEDNLSGDPLSISMSETAIKLANIQTSVINKHTPKMEVRVNGTVKFDERHLFTQSAHISGRIDDLLVNFTGESVEKGDVLAQIYSPELVSAQEELFQAYKIKDTQPELYRAARGKLLNWRLTDDQIDGVLENGSPRSQIPVLSDVSGVVIKKMLNLGDHVNKGQSIFEVADLSKVWVLFDVYESDLKWVKEGDDIEFSIKSQPGVIFNSTIAFIDPVINPKTRATTIRIEISNNNLNLKPEMFAVGTIFSSISESYLTVPKSAVMWTGKKSVVYVKQESEYGLVFKMKEVILGASLGDSYAIEEGISVGDEIATNGTFSIDAAAQLAGKPSMMSFSPEITDKAPVSVQTELVPLFHKYLDLKEALVNDNFEESVEYSKSLFEMTKNIDMESFRGDNHMVWMEHSKLLLPIIDVFTLSKDIIKAREIFTSLSNEFISIAVDLGPFDEILFVQHCPMANDNTGGDWISDVNSISNPYFGSAMLKCGKVTLEIK
ncbi:MAG: efflux transporter periplasmic adaptor subunit [Bacteroidetes bacterium]|nr:MAG: efflux transporter periplasmic adaptor subunit [Bacteroidota bacterium]